MIETGQYFTCMSTLSFSSFTFRLSSLAFEASISDSLGTETRSNFKEECFEQEDLLEERQRLARNRHLAFMKFISEMYERKKGGQLSKRHHLAATASQSRHPRRRLSGSMKVSSSKNQIPRRSSLGILPGSIGIGSGVVVDFPTPKMSPSAQGNATECVWST